VFEAEMAVVEFGIDVGYAAPDAVGAIAELGLQAERFSNGRVNPVAGDYEVGLDGGSIFEMEEDGIGALFEVGESVVQVDGPGRYRLSERGLQFGTMDGDAGAIVGGKGNSFDMFAVGILHEEAAKGAATRSEAQKNIRVNLIEGPDGVGPEAHAGADLF
jgi:hypothetical protein